VRCTASTAAQRTSGDFGTETLARVAGKLTGYARLTAATAITTPILVWLPTTHADWYGRKVLDQAKIYAEATTVGTGDCNNIRSATRIDFAAINYACGQRGLPYVWGGNGTVDGGFDCSGLTTAAYAAAAITLPRTADSQYRAAAPDRPSIENNPEPTDLPLRPEQHAPPGVDVKDLRPLRGRPCGPIPDPDASTRRAQRQAERSQKRSQTRTRS
jgi:cell wall-associated NlpC family hydrolase